MRYALLTLALTAVVGAAEPPKSSVRFPNQPTPNVPVPQPSPTPVIRLVGDQWYVVESDVDGELLDRPTGLVSVTKATGPLFLRGKFVDGNGKIETRSYKGPHIFMVEATGVGIVYLDFIPYGYKSRAEISSRVVDVDAGGGPRPPPIDPKPPIPPNPDPSPSPFPGDGLRVLVVYEQNDLGRIPASQLHAMQSGNVRAYLNAKCAKGPDGKTPDWRMFDKDVILTNVPQYWKDLMARPRKSLPWVYIGTGKAGYEGPVPMTEAEFLALLQKYGGPIAALPPANDAPVYTLAPRPVFVPTYYASPSIT